MIKVIMIHDFQIYFFLYKTVLLTEMMWIEVPFYFSIKTLNI